MANCFYQGKEVRSRSDRDRDVKLSWAHTVTLTNKISILGLQTVARLKHAGLSLTQHIRLSFEM